VEGATESAQPAAALGRAKHESIAIHEAFQRGDLASLNALLGDPPDFPNSRGVGEIILEDAIYWSPLPFIRTLLELGANPRPAIFLDS